MTDTMRDTTSALTEIRVLFDPPYKPGRKQTINPVTCAKCGAPGALEPRGGFIRFTCSSGADHERECFHMIGITRSMAQYTIDPTDLPRNGTNGHHPAAPTRPKPTPLPDVEPEPEPPPPEAWVRDPDEPIDPRVLADWTDPVTFRDEVLIEFPVDAFPPWLANFATALSVATQTSPDFASMLLLGVLAMCLQKDIEIELKPDVVEPVCLGVLPTMESGDRKSTNFKAVLRPIREWEAFHAQRMAVVVEQAKAGREVLEKQIERLKMELSKAKDEGEQKTLLGEMNEKIETLTLMPPVVAPVLFLDDITPEPLITQMVEQGGKMAIAAPEADIFETIAGRYSKGIPNMGIFLRGPSGDSLKITRRGRDEILDDPALTMILSPQPDLAKGLSSKPGFRGRGLLARYLYSTPPSWMGHRDPRSEPMPPVIRATYHAGIRCLLKVEPNKLPVPGRPYVTVDQPRRLRFDEEAQELMYAHESEVEAKLAPLGTFADTKDWGAKLHGHVARIAALIHVSRYADYGAVDPANLPPDVPPDFTEIIDPESTIAAIRIGEYCTAHALAAFADMGADEAHGDAQFILQVIDKWRVDRFKHQELWQKVKARRGFQKVDRLDEALKILVDRGYLKEIPVDRETPGRKHKPVYLVNPALLG